MKRFTLILSLFCAFVVTAWGEVPFKVSKAPTNGTWDTGTTWYFINFAGDAYHSGGYLAAEGAGFITSYGYDGNGDARSSKGRLMITQTTKPVKPSALWCIVGDETAGFTFYNKMNPYLRLGMTSNAAETKLYGATDIDGITYRFMYQASTCSSVSNAATFYYTLENGNKTYWNDQDDGDNDYLKGWASDNAVSAIGSAVQLVEVTDAELEQMAKLVNVPVSTEDAKTYFRLKNLRSTRYAKYNGDNADLTQTTETDLSTLWYVISNEDGSYSLYNCLSQKKYAGLKSFTDAGVKIYIKENPYCTGYVCVSTDSNLASNCWDDSQSGGFSSGGWYPGKTDYAGTSWSIEIEKIQEEDVIAELTTKVADAERLKALIGEGGKTAGYCTQSSVKTLSNALSAAKRAMDDATIEATELFDCLVQLQVAINGLETVLPTPGSYYHIISACDNVQANGEPDSRAGQLIYVDNIGEMHFAAIDASVTTPLGSVFRFDAADNGKFYIYSVERGTYLQDVTYGGRALATETNKSSAKAVTITNMGYENRVSLRPDGQNMIHAQESGAKIVGWDNNDYNQASAWKLEEVEDITSVERNVTISAAGWSTLCLGYNATIPAGVEAYAVSSVEGNVANLEPVTDVIPAKCPVLIKGEAAPHNFAFTTSTAEAPAVNELRGTIFNTYVAPEANTTAYVLANGANGVGMYVAALNKTENGSDPAEGGTGTHFLNNANKAYLPVQATEENPSRSLVFSFGGEETAIKDINGVENSGKTVIYDLSGRRVQKLGKGLYIVNGKKVVM